MGDLRIECRFKNAALYNAMVHACCKLASDLQDLSGGRGQFPLIRATAERSGVYRHIISGLLNLTSSPWGRRGHPNANAVKLAESLDKPFTELFPASLYALKLPQVIVKEVESENIISLQEARRQKLLPSTFMEDYSPVAVKDAIDKMLATLTPRQEQVVRKRFGLDGNEMTLQEIGEDLGVNRERIRQIEAKALRNLRGPLGRRALREYVRD